MVRSEEFVLSPGDLEGIWNTLLNFVTDDVGPGAADEQRAARELMQALRDPGRGHPGWFSADGTTCRLTPRADEVVAIALRHNIDQRWDRTGRRWLAVEVQTRLGIGLPALERLQDHYLS